MRIWSLHPRHLDAKGLVALWRETLLAQKVLQGGTKGYRNHPQLTRFRAHAEPLAAIGFYLAAISAEATARAYRFDHGKIAFVPTDIDPIEVTTGQLAYEWSHLKAKLETRDPVKLRALLSLERPDLHPLFRLVEGSIAAWEKT